MIHVSKTVGFSIFVSVSFLLMFQKKNHRKATHNFVPRLLVILVSILLTLNR